MGNLSIWIIRFYFYYYCRTFAFSIIFYPLSVTFLSDLKAIQFFIVSLSNLRGYRAYLVPKICTFMISLDSLLTTEEAFNARKSTRPSLTTSQSSKTKMKIRTYGWSTYGSLSLIMEIVPCSLLSLSWIFRATLLWKLHTKTLLSSHVSLGIYRACI